VVSSLPDAVVVGDMEAGIEHLSWAGGTLRHVDLLLIVAQPQVKSLMTAARTVRLARQLGIPRPGLVGSRSERPGDDEYLAAFAAEHELELLAVVPRDEAVVAADRLGACVLDTHPGAPAVAAIAGLADRIQEVA
jgi:CO dehydrogenase maturation factor